MATCPAEVAWRLLSGRVALSRVLGEIQGVERALVDGFVVIAGRSGATFRATYIAAGEEADWVTTRPSRLSPLRRAVGLLAVASVALTGSALACSNWGYEPNASCGSDRGTDGGIPYLTALSVTNPTAADSSTPMTLSPAFSANVHDYY